MPGNQNGAPTQKKENLDNYFTLARATDEKLQQMAERVETSFREREKFIQSNLDVTKRRHETVNDKLWNLETKMDTMSRDQAEIFCAVQSKLDALSRNSINKE